MALLDPAEAEHFCQFNGAGHLSTSFRGWAGALRSGTTFTEGQGNFGDFKNGALREIERLLFLATSHYRRSLDLLMPSSSAWAHVTMYYGSFFAAKALMGMFGAWKLKGDLVIDVAHSAPGAQRFSVSHRQGRNGSHEGFWDFFYSQVIALTPWVEISVRHALTPVNNDPAWLTRERNEVNYDTHQSCDVASSFQQQFRRTKLRTTLPGSTSTQFAVLEALLSIAAAFAHDFGLNTDALGRLSNEITRRRRVESLVLDPPPPNLGRLLLKRVAFG